MSLATCSDNKPWISEVHYVFDNELNLYFRSTPQRRHSIEILKNANVSGNIVTQHSLGQKVRGVYFEGSAERILNVTKDHVAYQLYCQRFDTNEEILAEAEKETGHVFYKITVQKFYVFDGYESSPSTKYELGWK